MTTWYRTLVPFDVQAPAGLTQRDIRNVIAGLWRSSRVRLPEGWTEAGALEAATEADADLVAVPTATANYGTAADYIPASARMRCADCGKVWLWHHFCRATRGAWSRSRGGEVKVVGLVAVRWPSVMWEG